MLSLHTVAHPHTGLKVEETMKEWEIWPSKILMVITDNGANMIKAFRRYFIETEPDDSYETEQEVST